MAGPLSALKQHGVPTWKAAAGRFISVGSGQWIVLLRGARLADRPAMKRLLILSSPLGQIFLSGDIMDTLLLDHPSWPVLIQSTVRICGIMRAVLPLSLYLPSSCPRSKNLLLKRRRETNFYSCIMSSLTHSVWIKLHLYGGLLYQFLYLPLSLWLSPKVLPVSHPAVSPGPLSGRWLCSLRS